MVELIEIQEMIEKLRDELHKISKGRSLTDPEVLRASYMLDVLLSEYQRKLNDWINQ